MKRKGFTLIELVVVMAIIAILALMVIGAILVARASASRTQNINNANAIRAGIEADFAKHPNTGYTARAGSFQAVAAGLGITLGSSVCNAAASANEGGGTVTVTAGRIGPYTVTPSDVTTAQACTGTLTPITGP